MSFMVAPNQALKLTVASWVQITWPNCLPAGRWWVEIFIIQFLVPITLILINLVISMNLFCWLHYENYQRRIPIYREPVR
jgi:hypothetical protein